MEEEFKPAEFIREAKAKAETQKRQREEEAETKRAEEKEMLLDAIRTGAARGDASMNIKLTIWKPEEVEDLFDKLVTVTKVRGRNFKIKW